MSWPCHFILDIQENSIKISDASHKNKEGRINEFH